LPLEFIDLVHNAVDIVRQGGTLPTDASVVIQTAGDALGNVGLWAGTQPEAAEHIDNCRLLAGEEEENLLPGVLDQQDNSRLACCVNLIPELDGLVVRLPKSQY
jgi:hypothetical protein